MNITLFLNVFLFPEEEEEEELFNVNAPAAAADPVPGTYILIYKCCYITH
jgi:hypothetical protein